MVKTKKKRHELIILPSSSSTAKSKSNKSTLKNKSLSSSSLKENKVMKKRWNEEFITLLDKLSSLMMKHGEPFRARAYQKAQESIMIYPNDIYSVDQIKNLPGIGTTITSKLNEYVDTGTLKLLEREKNNPVNLFTEIYGIGPKKAKELVDKGITTLDELMVRAPELLNENQRVGLKYYQDILKRIPRAEIEEYQHVFGNIFNSIPDKLDASFEIVGSFRRGAADSGDIDVIITSKNSTFFKKFIDQLVKDGIIIEVLSRGASKCLVICKLPGVNTARRVDFLYSTPEEYPFAILYFTGSKIFNTVMRQYALNKGLTMNEHGLYKMDGKKKGEKINHIFHNEKDIFDYLGLVYKDPVDRRDGRDIIPIGQKINTPTPIDLNNNIVEPVMVEEAMFVEPVSVKHSSKNKTLKKKSKGYNSEAIRKVKKLIQLSPTISSTSNVLLDTPKPIINAAVSETINTTSPFQEKKDMINQWINNFKMKGINVLNELSEEQLGEIIVEANKAYYNNMPLMTDNEFDIIKEYIESKYPSNKIILEIGAPIEKNKVKLPYFMGSMDKIKPDSGALDHWKEKFKGPYVLSCKLDGVSGLYVSDSQKLYTRGDGVMGQDISYLIPYLRLPKKKGLVIRGEFIIPKTVFLEKYKGIFANCRNMVAGIINKKKVDDKIKDIHFVSYELILPIKKPSEQMMLLQELDIDTVLNKTVDNVTNESLSKLLVEWRQNYIYDIDGIIVTNNKIYDRKDGSNPEQSFAFKMVLSDQVAEAKVVDVIWNPSKDGYLKPRVRIEPINLGGVTIEYATGFNASFIENNKIGVGSVIEIIRSGDVIPHIKSVTVPAEMAKMPDVPYKWNKNHVDVLLENIGSNETVRDKNITGFFRGIEVEGLSSGNIGRIVQAGYDSVPKILNMSESDFLKVDGFKNKLANKIYLGIKEKINEASLVTLMSATNIFGRGFSEKRLALILNELPNILVSSDSFEKKVALVSNVKGMAKKSAIAFVEKIGEFIDFLNNCGLSYKLNTTGENMAVVAEYDKSHPLYGKTVVMSGFRDKELGLELKKIGANVGTNVSKNTFLLLVKDKEDETTKIEEAKNLGIPILTLEEFRKKYIGL